MTSARPTGNAPGRRRFDALDGVRGLFMTLFMLFHFGATVIAGAWTGINLFFVLSAYLITSLLLAESTRYGSIDTLAFYRRRARRLVPALVLVLGSVGVYGLVAMESDERSALGGDLLASAGFVVNWRLISRTDDYFGDLESPSLVRHLWTLAVEEQFYLLVPVVLGLLFALASRRVIAVLMVAVAVALAWLTSSLGVGSPSQDARVYYGTDTRGQVLALGVALAVIAPLGAPTHARLTPRGVDAIGWVGLLVSLGAMVVVAPMEPAMFDRGGMLVLALGAAAVTYACARPERTTVSRALSAGPLVWLGQRSYSLYLWHWPVNVILHREVPGLPVAVHLVVGVAITLVLSLLTYRHLEEPIMRGGLRAVWPNRGSRRIAGMAAAAIVVAPVWLLLQATSVEEPGARAWDEPGTRSADEGALRVMLYGDSVANGITKDLPRGDHPDLDVSAVAVDGCGLVNMSPHLLFTQHVPESEECRDLRSSLGPAAAAAAPDVVVLMGGQSATLPQWDATGRLRLWSDPEFQAEVFASLDDLTAQVRDVGVEHVAIMTLPCRSPASRFLELPGLPAHSISHLRDDPESVDLFSDPREANADIVAWAEDTDVAVLDLYTALGCDGPYRDDMHGADFYGDHIHFSAKGTAWVWSWLDPVLHDIAATGGDR